MNDNYIKGKNKEDLLKDLYGTSQPGSVVHEQQKMAIFVRCTEDLEKAIHELKKKINFLDVALVIATCVGAIATALMAYKAFIA